MKIWVLAPFVLFPSAWAQTSLAPPQLGFVLDSAHALRPAFGLAGNFILGPSIASAIVTQAFGGTFGLLKTASSVAAFDAQGKLLASIAVAGGPALFAFSPSGATGLVYIPSARTLVEWRGTAFAPVTLNNQEMAPDAVLAIAYPTPFEASLFVERNDTIWELNLPLGKVGTVSQKALIGVRTPLLALPSGDLVYSDARGIVVRKTDASEVHIAAALPAGFSLQQMNRDWAQLTDLNGGARFAIRTAPGREGFYQLPE
jgi:hypothetical protein